MDWTEICLCHLLYFQTLQNRWQMHSLADYRTSKKDYCSENSGDDI